MLRHPLAAQDQVLEVREDALGNVRREAVAGRRREREDQRISIAIDHHRRIDQHERNDRVAGRAREVQVERKRGPALAQDGLDAHGGEVRGVEKRGARAPGREDLVRAVASHRQTGSKTSPSEHACDGAKSGQRFALVTGGDDDAQLGVARGTPRGEIGDAFDAHRERLLERSSRRRQDRPQASGRVGRRDVTVQQQMHPNPIARVEPGGSGGQEGGGAIEFRGARHRNDDREDRIVHRLPRERRRTERHARGRIETGRDLGRIGGGDGLLQPGDGGWILRTARFEPMHQGVVAAHDRIPRRAQLRDQIRDAAARRPERRIDPAHGVERFARDRKHRRHRRIDRLDPARELGLPAIGQRMQLREIGVVHVDDALTAARTGHARERGAQRRDALERVAQPVDHRGWNQDVVGDEHDQLAVRSAERAVRTVAEQRIAGVGLRSAAADTRPECVASSARLRRTPRRARRRRAPTVRPRRASCA